jgi:hypothetical protein
MRGVSGAAALARRLPLFLGLCIVLAAGDAARGEEPSSRKEIIQALDELRDEYGLDAVRMQTHLLQGAIVGGSVLEASAGINGFEEQGGHRYLRFDVTTGIVYDDRSVKEPERPARIWADVVATTLKHFQTLDIPADGVALHIRFQHDAYRDRTELLRKQAEQPTASDEMHLRLGKGEITEFAHERLTANDLLEHAAVLLNGKPIRIDLSAIVPAQPPSDPVVPLFPEEE